MNKLFLIPLPAIVIGALAMYTKDVPTSIWSQNILGLILGVLLSWFLLRKPKVMESTFSVPISIILLLLTFLDHGLEGVHRWVSIGPIRLYIASIVLPILILGLWRLLRTKNWWFSAILSLGVSLLLALQPDAAQATAFIMSMVILLLSKVNNHYFRYSVLGGMALITFSVWIYLDSLPPVAYVEDIIFMVAEMGIVWFALGIISLVILPLPFILFLPVKSKLPSICLGIYFMVVLLSTLFGNFPVPLMGYGISPILGYFISLAWLINAKVRILIRE